MLSNLQFWNMTGRQSDKYGNLAQWWSRATIDTYLEKAQCFVQQYGMYRVPELDELLHAEVTVCYVSFMLCLTHKNVKVKFILEQAMKAQWWTSGIALLFL